MQPEKNKPALQPSAGWVFHPGDSSQSSGSAPDVPSSAPPPEVPPAEPPKAVAPPSPVGEVHWTASEYVAHDRGASWYTGLGLGAVSLAGLVFLLTHDYISAGMIIIVLVIFGAFATRQPRVLDYLIDERGITIGTKNYPYDIFKSFSVAKEGAIHSLVLMPLKRFMPVISVYYADEDEDKILQKISDYLPFEQYRPDVVDKMMHKIRF